MTKDQQTKHETFQRARNDIASVIDWLQQELEKYDHQEISWATVGTIRHIRENLIDTLASVSGIERDEIQNSLNELNEK